MENRKVIIDIYTNLIELKETPEYNDVHLILLDLMVMPTPTPTNTPTPSPTPGGPTNTPTPTSTPTNTPTSTPTSTPTNTPTNTPTATPTSIVENYGNLYNYYAVTNELNIANAGWHIPTVAEWDTLALAVDPFDGRNTAGGYLKEAGYSHWQSPNTDASNSSGFTGRPGGYRQYDGAFGGIYGVCYMWSSDHLFDGYNYYNGLSLDSGNNDAAYVSMNPLSSRVHDGHSVRLIKDDLLNWTVGDKYTGNDGTQYNTVKIGNQIWMSENSKETQYQDHSTIPEVINNTDWSNNTTGAMCYYVL